MNARTEPLPHVTLHNRFSLLNDLVENDSEDMNEIFTHIDTDVAHCNDNMVCKAKQYCKQQKRAEYNEYHNTYKDVLVNGMNTCHFDKSSVVKTDVVSGISETVDTDDNSQYIANVVTENVGVIVKNGGVSSNNSVGGMAQTNNQRKVSESSNELTVQMSEVDDGVSILDPNESVDTMLIWDSVNTKREKMNIARNLDVFKSWQQQTEGNFGFIPLSPLIGCHDVGCNSKVSCPLEAHNIVKNSGRFNFQKARIQLDSQFNMEVWESYLRNYWDYQLIQMLKFGFPLDFDEGIMLKSDQTNHKSALAYPDHVCHYLQEEKQFKAIVGPFLEPPLVDMHTSPFITTEKPDSRNRRVIVDLSWPRGHSVNAGVYPDKYLGTEFILTYPSVDDITAKVTQLGKGSLLYKVDISRAFRHLKMDPSDYNKMGLKWGGHTISTLVCHLVSGMAVAFFKG